MNSNKSKLSKSILEMKFMKRTKEKVEKQQFQEEGEEYFESQLTLDLKKHSGRFIIEPSYVFCEQLTDGRVSYHGMNPELEKLIEAEENEKRAALQPKEDVDISDEQMGKQWAANKHKMKVDHRYQKSVQTIKDEDEPVRKAPKFLRPKEENLYKE